MEPSQYKQQFLALLNALYPNGMEQPVAAIQISVENIRFFFYFDMQDFVAYQSKAQKKSRVTRKTLEERLTELDHGFLKELKISINEESKT